VVKDVGDPARVMDTRMVSTEPQFGHRMWFRVSGVMGYFSASGALKANSPEGPNSDGPFGLCPDYADRGTVTPR
jgi:hypothetical protein